MFELFISKRYLKSKRKINFISIISGISTAGIILGVAALVIVISVFNGFGELVTSMLVNLDPHLTVTAKNSEATTELLKLKEEFVKYPTIKSFSPFAEGKVIIKGDRSYEIVELKGIEESEKNSDWGIQTVIISGKFGLDKEEGIDKIVIGARLANRISCWIGDTITVSSIKNLEKMVSNFTVIPRTQRFVVSAVFSAQNPKYDVGMCFASLDAAKQVLNMHNRISGYEIRLHDMDASTKIKNEMLANFGKEDFSIRSWYDLHEDLYSVMLLERWGAFLLLSLIISVATFNILGSLTMTVHEKKKDIGVFRAMGMKANSILRIFMFEGLLVGCIGTLTGVALGLFVCWLQIEFKIYSLDSTKFLIDAIPMQVRFWDIFIIALASMFLTFLASYYPAKRAAKINIIDAIKYE